MSTQTPDPSAAPTAGALPHTGPVKLLDPLTGAVHQEFHRLEGQIHGRYRRYVNGKVAEVCHYERGLMHGEQTLYRKGEIHCRLPMVKGTLHGEALFFAAGQLAMSLTYAKGLKHGPSTIFRNGLPMTHLMYQNGHMHGDIISLDTQTGRPLARIPMQGGIRHGSATYWTADGYLTHSEIYRKGKRMGQAIDYALDGKVLGRRFFKDERLDGPSVRYHPSGKVAEVRSYQQGALVGVETYNDKGTQVSSHGVASGWNEAEAVAADAAGASGVATPGPAAGDSAPWWKSFLGKKGS